ncbi:MAG: acyl carrier protein [Acidobacteria bacterium]|nr:acyl carrier protein [Acidobacteriota bacterium]
MQARLRQEISELFAMRLGLEVPAPDTDLFAAGVLDSMAFIELLLQLENRYGLRVDLTEIEFDQFRSVDKISEFVAANAPPLEP